MSTSFLSAAASRTADVAMTKRLATAQLAARAFIKKRAAVAAEGRELQSPLVNTPVSALKDCFALASLGPDDVLVDFGSGTGVALLTACKLTGCRAIGIEIEHAKVKQSRDDIDACGLSDRVTVIAADFFSEDAKVALQSATVIFGFVCPTLGGSKLLKLCQSLLPPEARIVSYCFNWAGAGPDNAADSTIDTINWTAPRSSTTEARPTKAYLWHGKCHLLPASGATTGTAHAQIAATAPTVATH